MSASLQAENCHEIVFAEFEDVIALRKCLAR